MDTRLKKKINEYFHSIYLVDILVVALITVVLLSSLGDYININKGLKIVEENRMREESLGIILLFFIYLMFITKIVIILKSSNREEKIKSTLINNIIFVIKHGFRYKQTRTTLIVSISLALVVLITYLYFLATGGYENNIFVRFFKTYPFKGSVLMITILFLSMIYGLKKTLDIIVVNDCLKRVNEGNLNEDIKIEGSKEIRELIENINLIKAGYSEALEEGVQNERLKTELISNVSHDLKTPLTSIINYVNILKNEDKEDSDEVKEKINNISQKESDLYNEAYTLFFSNKYEDAINKANELLKNFPDSYMGYNIRGIAKAYSGDYDGGMEDIDNSLKINETYGYGRFNKALTYELYDNMDEALKWYNKALEVEEYVWSYYGIASIYGRKADVANTMKYLNKAISMDSEVRVVAKDEHDFDPVRNSKEFQEAVYN